MSTTEPQNQPIIRALLGQSRRLRQVCLNASLFLIAVVVGLTGWGVCFAPRDMITIDVGHGNSLILEYIVEQPLQAWFYGPVHFGTETKWTTGSITPGLFGFIERVPAQGWALSKAIPQSTCIQLPPGFDVNDDSSLTVYHSWDAVLLGYGYDNAGWGSLGLSVFVFLLLRYGWDWARVVLYAVTVGVSTYSEARRAGAGVTEAALVGVGGFLQASAVAMADAEGILNRVRST